MKKDQIERMAQAIHEKYRTTMQSLPDDTTGSPLAAKSWEQLSAAEKEANRAQASDVVVKLEALGFTFVPADNAAAVPLAVSADALEALAE